MLTTQTLTEGGVQRCLARLRHADVEELAAAGLLYDAYDVMAEAVHACTWAEEALWNGVPVAMFGVRPLAGGEVGVPWMLATEDLCRAEHAAVARAALRAVCRMREQFPVLTNIVHARNRQAIRFIEWLGFTVADELTGPGYEFNTFHWRRECATR